MTTIYFPIKRVVDVTIAATLLVLSFPLWLIIAILVNREDRGPVFYSGTRVGLDGALFQMHKFRTMVVEAERFGGPSTPANDPRLTRTGRWLRETKLDELPQLVNVLRGEMSIVGPRPQVPSDVERYSEDERRLLAVKPGITDWSSIRFRDEGDILRGLADPDAAYDELIRPEKIRLGLEYVYSVSLTTDLRILLRTAQALFGRQLRVRGVAQQE